MEVLFWVLVIAAAVAAVWYVISAGRRAADREAGPKSSDVPVPGTDRVRPPLAEFHVRGIEAQVYFDVPIPASGADEVLRDLLVHEAIVVVGEKRSNDLPISDVTVVKAFGKTEGGFREVGSRTLEEPGVLPDIQIADLIPRAAAGFDVSDIGSALPTQAPELGEVSVPESLGPIGSELRLTARLGAGLRTMGVDPALSSAGDIVVGLLRLGGYDVQSTGDNTFLASRAGVRTFVKVVDHVTGSYPQLEESDMDSFTFGFASSGADNGILVTDKFGPYAMYDKERRNPKARFLTRERIQAFVDAMGIS
ncbi:MAG: hypothetical protein KJN71_07695 [Acidimicrobiia bacterium]|nr:hypothetical protein [Acidimicrobiia bacterium]